jgi:2-polyprenyl-3-methyl-5-hydroxy-6-metoxy-1,4-benzoquinol methylase
MIGDVHDRVAERLAKIAAGPILDLGGGNGTLAKALAKRGLLRGRGLSRQEASVQADRSNTPLTVTKRGCLIWARRP